MIHEALVKKAKHFSGRIDAEILASLNGDKGLFFSDMGNSWKFWHKFAIESLSASWKSKFIRFALCNLEGNSTLVIYLFFINNFFFTRTNKMFLYSTQFFLNVVKENAFFIKKIINKKKHTYFNLDFLIALGSLDGILKEADDFKDHLSQNLGASISLQKPASISMMNTVLQVKNCFVINCRIKSC